MEIYIYIYTVYKHIIYVNVTNIVDKGNAQGFMQDKIIASHTCFGEHMDVNC